MGAKTALQARMASGCLLALAVATCLHAEPDLSAGRPAGPLTVYPDTSRADRFYYPPGDLRIAPTPDGLPDMHLLQVRYTGSFATGDRGVFGVRSLLSFRIEMVEHEPAQMQGARNALAAHLGRRADLRPLPITRLETMLVYTPAAEEPGPSTALTGGRFEAQDDAGRSSATAYWRERTWVLRLDDASAQVMAEALERGQVAVSLGYAFYARGVTAGSDPGEVTGCPELAQWLNSMAGAPQAQDGETKAVDCLVKAGAVAVTMDAHERPQLVRQVDINESAPPGYPVLDVRCYDFRDALRAELQEKQVEVVAQGVGGSPVSVLLVFDRSQPDLYARTVRFRLPVRLDMPYRFRVTQIKRDGSVDVGEWQERESWARLVDVTTATGAVGAPAGPGGQDEPEEDEDEPPE